MPITTAQVKEIGQELARLKPAKVTLDGNRSLTVKEAVIALAPKLERLKKRGFDSQQLAELLHERGIEVKPPTLMKYLNEYRCGKQKNIDTPAPPAQTRKAVPVPQPGRPTTVSGGLPSRRTYPWMNCSGTLFRFSANNT